MLKNVPADPEAQTRSYSDPNLPINTTLVQSIVKFVKPVPRRRAVPMKP